VVVAHITLYLKDKKKKKTKQQQKQKLLKYLKLFWLLFWVSQEKNKETTILYRQQLYTYGCNTYTLYLSDKKKQQNNKTTKQQKQLQIAPYGRDKK
jgi:dipeptide/tripeptide permease